MRTLSPDFERSLPAHSELPDPPHLLDLHGLALVRKGGISGDHKNIGHLGERGDDVFCQCVAEELLLGVTLIFTKGRTAIEGLSGKGRAISP